MADMQASFTRPEHLSRTTSPCQYENPRALAACLLRAVISEGRSLTGLLGDSHALLERASDRALTQELCYGVLRWYPRLQALANRLLDKPLRARDQDLYALLLAGLYQLLYLDKPAHAVVHETVNAARALDKPWATGVINAVLRHCQRRLPRLLHELDAEADSRWAHPDWLLALLQADWPGDWQAMVDANNQRPPLILRVNARHHSVQAYGSLLDEAGIAWRALAGSPTAIHLPNAVAVDRLPGFARGWVSVQDAGAQIAAAWLQARPGERVLDACAAPGGKTCHILEREPDVGELVALDIDPRRLRHIQDNLARLDLQATLQVADAVDTAGWWDGKPFDRILLDAPCSATGVIRRHPDIKVLRRATDIQRLVSRQHALLEALWPLLAPGGMLLYVTCSVLKRENVDQMQRFIHAHPDCQALVPEAGWGRPLAIGRQILPGEQGMDGFYYASLVKTGTVAA